MIRIWFIFALSLIAAMYCASIPGQFAQTAQTVTPPIAADVQQKVTLLSSSDPGARAAAACALGKMQRRAVAAIPNLVLLLGDGTALASHQSCGQQEPFEAGLFSPCEG